MIWDTSIALIAAGVLLVTFARALWHKLADFGVFAASVADYEIVPRAWAVQVAWGLVAAEAVVVLGLLAPFTREAAAASAVMLLSLYAFAMAANLLRGHVFIDCGCGTPGQGLSWFLVARNVLLIGIAGLILLPMTSRQLALADVTVIALSVLTTLLVLLVVEQAASNDAHRRASREHSKWTR